MSIEGDGLSTALIIMGCNRAAAFIREKTDAATIFIKRDGAIIVAGNEAILAPSKFPARKSSSRKYGMRHGTNVGPGMRVPGEGQSGRGHSRKTKLGISLYKNDGKL